MNDIKDRRRKIILLMTGPPEVWIHSKANTYILEQAGFPIGTQCWIISVKMKISKDEAGRIPGG